eukprot:100318-Prymnesium_polylepis.3
MVPASQCFGSTRASCRSQSTRGRCTTAAVTTASGHSNPVAVGICNADSNPLRGSNQWAKPLKGGHTR